MMNGGRCIRRHQYGPHAPGYDSGLKLSGRTPDASRSAFTYKSTGWFNRQAFSTIVYHKLRGISKGLYHVESDGGEDALCS